MTGFTLKSEKPKLAVLLALVFPVLAIAGGAQAYPETRASVSASMTAEFAGSAQGAFYVIDSGQVRQYDTNGKLRHTQTIGADRKFFFSPKGYHYAVAQLDKAGEKFTPYTVFDVMHRELYQGQMFTGGKLFLDNDGRCVLSKPRTVGSVELIILDQAGEQIGLSYAAACDTVVFAPDTRGFIATGPGRGLTYSRLTGEQIATYPAADRFSFSVSGRRVALFRQGVISLFEDQRQIATHRAPSTSSVKIIYQDSKNRIFLLTKKRLYSLNGTEGNILLEYTAIVEGWIYTDFDYTPVSDLLAITLVNSLGSTVALEERAKQSSLRVLTPTGDEYRMIHDYTERGREGFPRVQMGAKGSSLFFILADGFRRVIW